MPAIGIIGAVGQNLSGRQASDQAAGRRYVVLLAGAESEAYRQAQCIDYGMELGSEAAAGTAESLGLRSPFYAARQ